jgi:hypothetical protein
MGFQSEFVWPVKRNRNRVVLKCLVNINHGLLIWAFKKTVKYAQCVLRHLIFLMEK